MESTAVSSGSSSNGSRSEKSRRQTSDYLQIDPTSTFINNTARNGYEELPENFLDTISPHPTTPAASSQHASGSPQLASLTTMSMSNDSTQGSSSYPVLSLGSSYAHLEKSSFGNGPAGLLSPLHLDGRRPSASHDFGRHVTSGIFIKQEDDNDLEGHMLMQSMSSSQQQEMERIAQAETPPAVSNVELASTMIATLIGGEPGGSPSPHAFGSSQSMMQQMELVKEEDDDDRKAMGVSTSDQQDYLRNMNFAKPTINRKIYSTHDSNDPLNAEIDDDIYIDTRELCKRIAYELKQHSIPQAIFAERILCRSQGTLSDLLRNPKPWNKLKSGRETFRRMFNWVRQPLATRLGILDMYKSENGEIDMARVPGLSPPTPAQNVRQARRTISDGDGPNNKRPRLVFTDIQKRTLQAIFKETQRPSREMQQTIAEHLRLDLSTVANFFMNARRRSRLGPNSDEPQAYHTHVRTSSPQQDLSMLNSNGGLGDDNTSLNSSHLDGDLYKLDDPLSGCLTIDGVNYESPDLSSALTSINDEEQHDGNDGDVAVKEELEDEGQQPDEDGSSEQQRETSKS